jgi:hypothetical protein
MTVGHAGVSRTAVPRSAKRRGWARPTTAAATGAASILAAAAPAAGAERPAICGTSFDPYGASPATLDACGLKVFPVQSKIQHSDGSVEYRYLLGSTEVTSIVPPPGFDPVAATADELRRYGLPQEPPASEQVRHDGWVEAMRRMRLITPPDKLIEDTGVTSAPAKKVAPSAETQQHQKERSQASGDEATAVTRTSLNWSGNVSLGGAGQYFDTLATYDEPNALTTTCAGNSALFWDGVGGWFSGRLGQIGTSINTPGLGQHQAWWEVLPDRPYVVAIPLFATANSGVHAETDYVPYSPTGQYQFWIQNASTGASSAFQVNSNSYDGRSGEFIAERPTVGGSLPPLTNFGSVLWKDTWETSVPSGAADVVDMQAASGHTLATATAANYNGATGEAAQGFQSAWKNCS